MIDTVPFMDVGPNMVGIRQFDSSLNTKSLFLKYAQQNMFLVVHFVPAKIPHSLARWYRTGDENYISSVTLRLYNINVLYILPTNVVF
jgi:hypothetical protein